MRSTPFPVPTKDARRSSISFSCELQIQERVQLESSPEEAQSKGLAAPANVQVQSLRFCLHEEAAAAKARIRSVCLHFVIRVASHRNQALSVLLSRLLSGVLLAGTFDDSRKDPPAELAVRLLHLRVHVHDERRRGVQEASRDRASDCEAKRSDAEPSHHVHRSGLWTHVHFRSVCGLRFRARSIPWRITSTCTTTVGSTRAKCAGRCTRSGLRSVVIGLSIASLLQMPFIPRAKRESGIGRRFSLPWLGERERVKRRRTKSCRRREWRRNLSQRRRWRRRIRESRCQRKGANPLQFPKQLMFQTSLKQMRSKRLGTVLLSVMSSMHS